MGFFSGKKLLLLGFLAIILAVIPVTVYLVQKQQEIRSRAVAATVLSFSPSSSSTSPIQKNVGDKIDINIMVNPGTNLVTFARFTIAYDKDKLSTSADGFLLNSSGTQGFTSAIEGPTSTPGKLAVALTIGADPTRAIQTTTKVATISFKALATTTTPVMVSFENVIVYANNETGNPNATYPDNLNVLSSTTPAYIAIASSTTLTPTAGPTTTPGPTGVNQLPVCTALNIDRTTSGTAPFSITFTANGNDPDGTISRVNFNFGDGPVQTINQNGGIGTNSVSVQVAHTYNNPGTFQASATLVDGGNAISVVGNCTQTITVLAASGSATITPTSTPIPTATLTPTPTMATPGPGQAVLGIGAVGIILSIIGGLLFLAL